MTRAWHLVLDIDRGGGLPPFLQIARALAADIQRGRLRPGDRLPGSRRLAAMLDVHRNTVLAALAELTAEGWIETAPARGTFIAPELAEGGARPPRRLDPHRRTPSAVPFSLADVPAPYGQPDLPRGTLNLSSGAPDIRLVPARAIGRAYRRILSLRAREVLAYGDIQGHPALRTALAGMLASTRGLAAGAGDVFVTRGSQMALALTARALVRPGDVVAVEALGYRPAWEAFRAAGATLLPIPVDRDGLDIAALTRAARRVALRAVYVTPHHQYPTTVTLKAARRLALPALAREHRFAIVEDDYDHEFHYDGRPVLPLASADDSGAVIYVGTLSKVLAPGLRVGYIVAAPPVLRGIAAIRSHVDIQGDLAAEATIAALMAEGEVQRHIARVRRVYAERRDILANSLQRTFGGDIEAAIPAGGMALWVKFGAGTDVDAWARRSIRRGVFWYPGRRYAFDGAPIAAARFSFAWLNERELPEAVRRLKVAQDAR